MRFFYVKENIELTLGNKKKLLIAVPQSMLDENKVPLDRIYCGNVAWECIEAKRLRGESSICFLSEERLSKLLADKRLKPYASGRDIRQQLQETELTAERVSWRLALVNGTGTMLGDTLVGASVLDHLVTHLKNHGMTVEIDVFLAWNARPDASKIWKSTGGIKQVFESSPTVSQLLSYDGFWDYSRLLAMPGYGSQHFADFYFNQFGVDPSKVEDQHKLPLVRVSRQALQQTRDIIRALQGSRPLVWVDPNASTPARSMPVTFFIRLLKQLTANCGFAVATASPLPDMIDEDLRQRIISLHGWTVGNLDRYFSALALADAVIAVDTLALHVAMGCVKPGIGFFALSDPEIRLKYSPQITGLLIPKARSLPYWGKHKGDDLWEQSKQTYSLAWDELDMTHIVHAVKAVLMSPRSSTVERPGCPG